MCRRNWILFCRDERYVIQKYFHMGFTYTSMLQFLANYHGINLSLRTLNRRLRGYGLFRIGLSSPDAIDNALCVELDGPGE